MKLSLSVTDEQKLIEELLTEEHDFVGIGFCQMDLIAKLRHPYIVGYKDDWVKKRSMSTAKIIRANKGF
ncbi:hypothetical protein KY285_026411 [Solanum tuberosum]|nr:hypothetical protein KY289_026656 [Solanum tuberosum]KAH0661521.1 hypothetical protein KY284_026452 [Solanum tuberosum]KAH0665205.1 hypothetical protein KY285_026411 [Solanum tuberosum]